MLSPDTILDHVKHSSCSGSFVTSNSNTDGIDETTSYTTGSSSCGDSASLSPASPPLLLRGLQQQPSPGAVWIDGINHSSTPNNDDDVEGNTINGNIDNRDLSVPTIYMTEPITSIDLETEYRERVLQDLCTSNVIEVDGTAISDPTSSSSRTSSSTSDESIYKQVKEVLVIGIVTFLVLVAILVVVPYVLVRDSSSGGGSIVVEPASEVPTTEKNTCEEQLLDMLITESSRLYSDDGNHNIPLQEDFQSPQYQAYGWLIASLKVDNNKVILDREEDRRRILQLYGLGTFYFSSYGTMHDWDLHINDDPTTFDNVCNWHHLGCDDHEGNTVVKSIQIQNDRRLLGTIPPELVFVSSTLEVLELDMNVNLHGPIPPVLFDEWSNTLRTFNIHGSGITGSIPPSIGLATNLEILNLGRNYFSGSIPRQIFENLIKLTYLDLSSHGVGQPYTNTIPTSIGYLQKVGSIWYVQYVASLRSRQR